MKRLIFAVGVCAMFLYAQRVSAFPGEGVLHRTTHFAHRVAYKIDNHVVHPVTHGIQRRLR